MPLKLICKTDKLKDFTKGKEYIFEQESYLMLNVKCDDGEYYSMTKYKMFEYFTFSKSEHE